MVKIGIIVGSDRDARVSKSVADFLLKKANSMNITDAEFEIVDIKDFKLPAFNETVPPAMAADYTLAEAKVWGEKIDSLDGYIFVTPEYNNTITASLKNGIDYLANQWGNKAASIVSYGSTLGVASQISLRLILANLNVAVIAQSGAFSLFNDFENMSTFAPTEVHKANIEAVISGTVTWSKGLKTIR